MSKHDWVTVGIKLIGVYFAVLGVTALPPAWLHVAVRFFQSLFRDGDSPYSYGYGESLAVGFIGGLKPVLYLAVACLLIKWTKWCVRMVGVEES